MMTSEPKTLMEAIRYFSDADTCLNFVASFRWPNGVACPTCGSLEVKFIASRRVWACKTRHPRWQFSVKVGSIFEDSAIPLDKWLTAMWMVANAKNGVSSYEISKSIGVSQKSAWFMLHRIRAAMEDGTFNKLNGTVEADETYIGGKARNMHKDRRFKTFGTQKVNGYMFRYLDEQVFRFNSRYLSDGERFLVLLRAVVGKRLTWAELTGAEGQTPA